MARPSVRARVQRFMTTPRRLPSWGMPSPGVHDPKIFAFNTERDAIVAAVAERLVERHRDKASRGDELTLLIHDCAHKEIARLERQRDAEAERALPFWKSMARRVARMHEEERIVALREIATHMAADVAGNFDPRVYWFARRVVPWAVTGAMQPPELLRGVRGMESQVDRLVKIEGPVEKLARLARRGTLVVVPTHSSNLDSLALGDAMARARLPPLVYGAGKNLFTNPIISFFMHNLGAYRVDRRVKAPLYKEVLKTYSCVMIERGYHSLFFPGGTRSRSGAIEEQLKLGLAGTGVEAFARNAAAGTPRPVYFVPVTINYALVMEAETLIADHLKASGQSRYIIDDDEFSRVDRWVSFFDKIRAHEGACVLRFGEPLDPFSNATDEHGDSISPQGRALDPVSYVSAGGSVSVDSQRDAAYTRELGRALVRCYERDTVIMGTQLVAHVLWRRHVVSTPGLDVWGRMRRRGEVMMERRDLLRRVGAARDRLRTIVGEGRVRMSDFLATQSAEAIVDRCVDAWSDYHRSPATRREASGLRIEDPHLLLYYQNRVRRFAAELSEEDELSVARAIAREDRA